MGVAVWNSAAWLAAACALGFGISAVFSAWLGLKRTLFLIPYLGLVSAFLVAFVRVEKIAVGRLVALNWLWGLVAALAMSIVLIRNVYSQPASSRSAGAALAFDLVWSGLAYGLVDGIFLSIMPVLAVSNAAQGGAWEGTLVGRLAIGAIAVAAGVLVSVCYHWGYREFRGRRIKYAAIGPGLMTLAVVLAANPLGALLSHPAMHIAAVLRGPETTVQLPPH